MATIEKNRTKRAKRVEKGALGQSTKDTNGQENPGGNQDASVRVSVPQPMEGGEENEKVTEAKRFKGSGRVIRKKGSPFLYVALYYFKIPIIQSTGDPDTPNNRKFWEDWLDKQIEKIKKGEFCFAEAFPDASEEKKRRFATLEGTIYAPKVNSITFVEIEKEWRRDVLSFKPEYRIRQLATRVDTYILPVFKDMTFLDIKQHTVKKFMKGLRNINKRTPSLIGRPLGRSTRMDILECLKQIWEYGCAKNNWNNLGSPFVEVKVKHSDVQRAKGVHFTEVMRPDFFINNPDWEKAENEIVERRKVLRFNEWKSLASHFEWGFPIFTFMLLTGAIFSEVAALQWRLVDLNNNAISILQAYHPHEETIVPYVKAKSRIRTFLITDAIRGILDEIKGQYDPDPHSFVFRSPGDPILSYNRLNQRWDTSVNHAGLIPVRSMYCLRHSFIAWSLVVGIEVIKVAALAGHSTRKMVDENYGRYVAQLEEDKPDIFGFFGEDFVRSNLPISAIAAKPSAPLRLVKR